MTYQFPQHLNRVHAWDRLNKQTVEVAREDWNPEQFAVLVTGKAPRNEFLAHYWVPVQALDFRYYGEPSDADEATRRQWARRQAADRREFYYSVHHLGSRALHNEVESTPEDHFGYRVYLNEERRRAEGRDTNNPSGAVWRSDQRVLARRRAAQHSREAVAEWDRQDRERDALRRA